MPITLDEITAREAQLLAQIAESQRLLTAYRLIRAEGEKFPPASRHPIAGGETRLQFHPEPAPLPSLPSAPAPVPPPANLEALSKGYGGAIRLVTWAIREMPGDFTVRDIAAVLSRAGQRLRTPKLSVILNRMKDERKLVEVRKGRGRTPSLYGTTAEVIARPLALAARHRASRSHLLIRAAL